MFVFNNHYFPRIFSHLDKIYLTVGSYHVTYVFQSESTLYSCLNVKELLARSRRDIWRLSDCNVTRTHNHLVCKRTVNHLAKLSSLDKWSSARLRTKWLWFWVPIQSHKIYFLVLLSGFGYNFFFFTHIFVLLLTSLFFSVVFLIFIMLKFVSDIGVQALMLFVVIFIDCMSLRQLTGSQCGISPDVWFVFFFN